MKKIFTGLFSLAVLFISGISFGQVTITSSDSLSCVDTCTTLTAHLVGDIPIDAGITIDDQYPTTYLPIGFTFNFYGLPYTTSLIGPNGTICFNPGLAGSFETWVATGPLLGQVPVENSICGPWCDVDIEYGGNITYCTTGTAPNRRYIVTFCHVAMFSCTSQYYTTQFVLYEGSDVIDIYVGHKDICTSWYGAIPGLAILGVQNAAGTKATVAPGHDYPSVYTCTDEGWRFTPNDTGTGVYYLVNPVGYAPVPFASSNIYWYNATTGAFIDSGLSITVCTHTATTYKAGAKCCADTSYGYYTVTPGGLITISTSSSNPTKCGLCDGSIIISGLTPGDIDTVHYDLGGVPQPVVWATVSGGGTILISGLCSGTYSNIIASEHSCSSPPAGPIVLTDPPIAITSISSTNPSSCGVCDGTITIGGLYPGYLFTLNYTKDGVAQPPLSVTSSGTGTITITGLCGAAPPLAGTVYANFVASFGSCVTPPAGPVTLAAPPPPPASIVSSTNATQCGKCDGSITIRPLPPLTLDSVFYSLGGVVQPPDDIVALLDSSVLVPYLCAGTYTNFSIVIDQCTYAVSGSATITQPKIIDNFSQATHYGCNGDTVFFTNLSSTPGPLYYNWTFGDGTSDTATNPNHVFAQGIYTVTLVATNLACSQSFSLQDSLIHPLVAAFSDSPVIVCQGSPITFTNNTALLSTPPLSYLWNFKDGGTSNAVNPAHTYNRSGTYNVQLVASNFIPCYDTAYSTVYIDSSSPIEIALTDSVFCRSTYVTFTGNFTTSGSTGFTWNFGDGDSTLNKNPASHSYDQFGTYTVTLNAYYRACKDTSTSKVINVFPEPVLNLGSDTSICPGSESITLTDDNNKSTAGAKWKWSTGQTTPSIVITAPGYYSCTVNINGCGSTDTIWVQKNCYMDIPNVFTPNGDGLNDYFFPRLYLTKGLTSFKMDIYNRWGQLIFETTTLDGSGWDGKLNGINQPEGVYVYIIDAAFQDREKEHHQGNVTLMR